MTEGRWRILRAGLLVLCGMLPAGREGRADAVTDRLREFRSLWEVPPALWPKDPRGGVHPPPKAVVEMQHREALKTLDGVSDRRVLDVLRNRFPNERAKDLRSFTDVLLTIATLDLPEAPQFIVRHLAQSQDLPLHFASKIALAACVNSEGRKWLVDKGLFSKDGLVLRACIDLAGRLKLSDAAERLREIAETSRDSEVVSMAIDALVEQEDASIVPLLREKAKEQDAAGCAALIGLGRLRDEGSLPLLLSRLDSRSPEARFAAIAGLGHLRDPRAGLELARRLKSFRGRERYEILRSLRSAAGQDLGTVPKDWADFFQRQITEPAGDAAGWMGEEASTSAIGKETAMFYGVPVLSNRALFIVDVSGSMNDKTSDEEGATKLQVLKRELGKALHGLEVPLAPQADRGRKGEKILPGWFNIFYFNEGVWAYKPKSVEATSNAVATANIWLNGMVAQGGTNYWDSFRKAFALPDGEMPDVIYFMTDGMPTQGKTTDLRLIAEAIQSWNKARRLLIHVVQIGEEPHPLMERIARSSGGEYVCHCPLSKK